MSVSHYITCMRVTMTGWETNDVQASFKICDNGKLYLIKEVCQWDSVDIWQLSFYNLTPQPRYAQLSHTALHFSTSVCSSMLLRSLLQQSCINIIFLLFIYLLQAPLSFFFTFTNFLSILSLSMSLSYASLCPLLTIYTTHFLSIALILIPFLHTCFIPNRLFYLQYFIPRHSSLRLSYFFFSPLLLQSILVFSGVLPSSC